MSFSATVDRATPPYRAYTVELRWAHIDKHLNFCLASNDPPRCGHLAGSYGGGLITKADIQERWRSMNELGSGK